MTYLYGDVPDKTEDGIKKEIKHGLTKIKFYFVTVHGVDPEGFDGVLDETKMTMREWLIAYLHLRNKHPKAFK